MEQIILWESDTERIHVCQRALMQALTDAGVPAIVTLQSEPPLISRSGLTGRLPVLEIRGQYWSLHPGQPFTADEISRLLKKLFP